MNISKIVLSLVFATAIGASARPLINADKNLPSDWDKKLFDRGSSHIYKADKSKVIGIPCGGLFAGQLYVRTDGTLVYWWIANMLPTLPGAIIKKPGTLWAHTNMPMAHMNLLARLIRDLQLQLLPARANGYDNVKIIVEEYLDVINALKPRKIWRAVK